MDKPKLGSPVKADIKRNCLLCSRWTVCRDPNKDMDYACSKFTNQFEQSMHDLFEQEYEEEKKEQRFLKKNKEKLSSKEVRSRFNSKINITSEHVKNDSIFDLIMETINSGSPLPPDLKINDKDIRKPPNVLEWMIEPEFIGGDQKPFAKQIQIAVHTMGEWCPKCSNEEYFECVPVDASVDDIKSEVIFLKNGKCPRCKSTKYDLVQDEYLIDPFEIIGILGQRSGKSILSTMMESYNTARWVLTPNLPATFRVLQSSVFTSSYTATTFGQAKGAFWDPLNAIFLDSEWFKTYHKFLNEEGNKLGEELYKHSETMLTYRHKNIVLAPASPSMRSLRGRTRITGVIDELGWFQTGKNKKGEDFERMNAKEVYIAIKRSLSTMRASYIKRFNQGYYQLPKPLLTLISSPKARNDQIMTRYREAEGSREVYRIKAPTWEANPEQTREVLSEEFRTDYVGAMRDYGCEPPMAANAWITDENLIEGAFTGPKNAITVTTRRFRTKSNKLATAGYYKTRRIPTYPNNGGAILGIDAGFSNNSFAFAVGYPTSIPDPEDEEEEDVIVGMNIALVGEIIPRKDYPISFTAVYKQLLQPLCSEFNVAVVISDTWQNKKLQQDLEDSLGISYFEYKLGLQEFIDYREGIYENIIQHPKLDMPFEDISSMTLEDYPNCFNKFPVAHLAFQMMTVQNTGTAVIKGEEGTTDDILRACVICHAGLQNEEVLDEVLSFSTATQPIQALGTVALASSGRSSNHSGMGSQNTSNIGVTASYGGSSRPATGNSSSSIGILGRK